MVEQILLILILQTMFFVFYYKFGFSVAKVIGRRVCPVCFAVSSTWLTVLLFRYFGVFQIDKTLVALLLAESVVGVSYLVEEFMFVRQVKLSEPLLKFGIIIYGTLAVSVFAFIQEFVGLALFIPIIIFGFLALTPIQKVEKIKNEKSTLLESKLKSCC